jgi:hypothetical protein
MLVSEIQLYEALREKLGDAQAKVITEYVEAKFESKKDSLATKQDIADLKTEIIASKVDILRWMIGTMIAVSGLIIAAMKLF